MHKQRCCKPIVSLEAVQVSPEIELPQAHNLRINLTPIISCRNEDIPTMQKLFIALICYGILSLTMYAVSAENNPLLQQRQQFKQAYYALTSRDYTTYANLSRKLRDYPLYYYFQYQSLLGRLNKLPIKDVQRFLDQYGTTHYGANLRRAWLRKLAKRKQWQTFLDFYTPQKFTDLQCLYVSARLRTHTAVAAAITDAKVLWLVNKGQPRVCNDGFDYLYTNQLLDTEDYWERIRLALANNQVKLAKSIGKRLPKSQQTTFDLWLDVHRKPADSLAEWQLPDTPLHRKILWHGIQRLAQTDFSAALNFWQQWQQRYAFDLHQLGQMELQLALASAKQDHPSALMRLAAVNKAYLDEELSLKRIRIALRQQNWFALADFIRELPAPQRNSLRWRYWLARAEQQQGNLKTALAAFKALAKERDYYGFLAADQIGAPYQMQDHAITYTEQEHATLLKNYPSVAYALEFHDVGLFAQARREWHHGTNQMRPREQAIAAALAGEWEWHDRAVFTTAKAGEYDDLALRFPTPFKDVFSKHAQEKGLDLAWVYGIARQESAFMQGAKSHVGATGLMQLMPATAEYVAKKIGLEIETRQDIVDVENNVNLGTAYLQQMLNMFSGNYMLATAAYNAGPGRSQRWAKRYGCLPADIWVELIPFDETKTYVRRVLLYTRIFEYRLGYKETLPIRVYLSPKHCPTTKAQRLEQIMPSG